MYVVELFMRKMRSKSGEEKEESWVIVKKKSGKVVKKMSYENYRRTKLPALANQNSPLAKALLKRGVDDEVVVQTPKGGVHYWVVEVRYHLP